MQLHSLTRPPHMRAARRVGRGGKRGKTSGSGGKGQTARAGHKIRPEMRDLIKKLPKRRGYGKNRARTVVPRVRVTVSLTTLDRMLAAGAVTPRVLVDRGVARRISGKIPTIKIVGNSVEKKFAVSGISMSAAARTAIEKAGGVVS